MNTLRIKKGWAFNIKGRPSARLDRLPSGATVGLAADAFPYVKPRLSVKEGDVVQIGSLLFTDKRHPDLTFRSPGGGKVAAIGYGPRRVVQDIVIALSPEEGHETFPVMDASMLRATARDDLKADLLHRGVWPFIRQLPFRGIADPLSTPTAIWISLGSADPFQPLPQVYLAGLEACFELGLAALGKLTDQVHCCWYGKAQAPPAFLSKCVTHRVLGPYPAADPGVVLYHAKTSPAQNRDWYVDGHDVAFIGEALQTGRYPVTRRIALSDGTPENSRHIETRLGVRLGDIRAEAAVGPEKQWVAGGMFSGRAAGPDRYLDLYSTSAVALDRAKESELFGFLRPGFKKLSRSRTVVSAVFSRPLAVNTDLHGEVRPCVNCGACAAVCPVDILPQFACKSIWADEMEEALAHGLLDCVECGLCAFVCPSKIELVQCLREARKQYHKELHQGA